MPAQRGATCDRRQLLSGSLALIGAGACRRPPSREEVLTALLNGVVTDESREVERRSHELALAAGRLLAAPCAAELDALRAAWKRAVLAWRRASTFRGPLVASEARARALYWPARREAIDRVLDEPHADGAVFVEQLGADVKGLYALEHLLFDGERAQVARSHGARGRQLILAYAVDIHAHARRVSRAVAPGADWTTGFCSAGQASINAVVSHMAETLERSVAARLSLVLWLDSLKKLGPSDIEGGPSLLSRELLLAPLLGNELLYRGARGPGLAELVQCSAPRLHDELSSSFSRAIAGLRALSGPIESVLAGDRSSVESALSAVKALEVATKTGMASALGVTLGFDSMDAD
jgi:predicted lipoprotein